MICGDIYNNLLLSYISYKERVGGMKRGARESPEGRVKGEVTERERERKRD